MKECIFCMGKGKQLDGHSMETAWCDHCDGTGKAADKLIFYTLDNLRTVFISCPKCCKQVYPARLLVENNIGYKGYYCKQCGSYYEYELVLSEKYRTDNAIETEDDL